MAARVGRLYLAGARVARLYLTRGLGSADVSSCAGLGAGWAGVLRGREVEGISQVRLRQPSALGVTIETRPPVLGCILAAGGETGVSMPSDTPSGGQLGRPVTRRRRWLGRPVTLAGTAIVAVAAGAGITIAATSGSSSPLSASSSLSSAASAPSPDTRTPPRGCRRVVTPRRAGVLCVRSPLGGALHGTLVLPKAGGGTVTVEIQNGKVASVSQSSITLKSADGFTKTYVVSASTVVDAQRNGIGSVKVGDQVRVTATGSGGTVTAIRVVDLSQVEAGLLPRLAYPGFHPATRDQGVGTPGGSTAASIFGGSADG
jgi:hypothetical protein